MSDLLRDKWNNRYAEADPLTAAPAQLLLDYGHLLPTQGLALDLACGLGANSLLLARHGLAVEAWDISEVAIASLESAAQQQHLPLKTLCCDVTTQPLPQQHYDVIIVSRFLERALAPAIICALKPGGLLFYQTWTVEKLDAGGPSNPHFLLQPNELLQLFSALRVVLYREEGRVGDLQGGLRNEAQLVAQRSF